MEVMFVDFVFDNPVRLLCAGRGFSFQVCDEVRHSQQPGFQPRSMTRISSGDFGRNGHFPRIPFLGTNSLSYDFPRMRRRDLTVGEFVVLRMIQQGYGLQNSLGKVFFTDTDEAAIFVKASTGRSVLMANLTNLAAWRADGRITSDEELKSDWLLLK
jgi:hypothetical protein